MLRVQLDGRGDHESVPLLTASQRIWNDLECGENIHKEQRAKMPMSTAIEHAFKPLGTNSLPSLPRLGRRFAIGIPTARMNGFSTGTNKILGQLEIVENRWVSERDQEGATILSRMGTVSSIRLDIELRALRIRDAFAYEVTVKDI